MPIKIKTHSGITSISIDGERYDVDKKGFFTIPDGIDPGVLSPHGFKLADESAEPEAPTADQAAAEAPAGDVAAESK